MSPERQRPALPDAYAYPSTGDPLSQGWTAGISCLLLSFSATCRLASSCGPSDTPAKGQGGWPLRPADRPHRLLAPTRLLDGLTSIFVTKVEAKGAGFHTRQAGLNLDGSLLFVTGTDQTDEDPEGTTPTGLRIIDTQTLKLVHQEEGIGKFVISDDGRYLFGTGFSSHFENHWAPQDGIGLKVLDLHTMHLAAHIEPDKAYLQLALSGFIDDGVRFSRLRDAGPAGTGDGKAGSRRWLHAFSQSTARHTRIRNRKRPGHV